MIQFILKQAKIQEKFYIFINHLRMNKSSIIVSALLITAIVGYISYTKNASVVP
jgi:hypothetical protein